MTRFNQLRRILLELVLAVTELVKCWVGVTLRKAKSFPPLDKTMKTAKIEGVVGWWERLKAE